MVYSMLAYRNQCLGPFQNQLVMLGHVCLRYISRRRQRETMPYLPQYPLLRNQTPVTGTKSMYHRLQPSKWRYNNAHTGANAENQQQDLEKQPDKTSKSPAHSILALSLRVICVMAVVSGRLVCRVFLSHNANTGPLAMMCNSGRLVAHPVNTFFRSWII